MNKPTEAEIKRFWEWCGFKAGTPASNGVFYWDLDSPTGEHLYFSLDLPPIDLNNLFKYAVPGIKDLLAIKFGEATDGWHCDMKIGEEIYGLRAENPALALFWAICKVREAN